MEDRVRVIRIVEYDGPRSWVEEMVARSIHGERRIEATGGRIRAATLGTYPEVLVKGEEEGEEGR